MITTFVVNLNAYIYEEISPLQAFQSNDLSIKKFISSQLWTSASFFNIVVSNELFISTDTNRFYHFVAHFGFGTLDYTVSKERGDLKDVSVSTSQWC